jgi:hypothetical protein
MKKIFSMILPLLFLSAGIALAFNVQDDPICSERNHPGYSYSGTEATPPLPLDPSEVDFLGEFDNNFTCDENEQQECHWAYIPPVDPEDQEDLGSWVKCSGEYRELDN